MRLKYGSEDGVPDGSRPIIQKCAFCSGAVALPTGTASAWYSVRSGTAPLVAYRVRT